MASTTCAFDGCDRPIGAKGARGWCPMHYQRWRVNGDPAVLRHDRCGPSIRHGEHNPNWSGDAVGYRGVHVRLRSRRGPAAAHSCEHCGNQARQWAYDYTCPNQRSSDDGPYSTDLTRYFPLCSSCHKVHDLAMREVVGHGIDDI